GLLPAQILIRHPAPLHVAVANPFPSDFAAYPVNDVFFIAQVVVVLPKLGNGLIGGDTLITGDSPAGPELQVVNQPGIFQKLLFGQPPADGPRGKETPFVIIPELRTPVGPGGEGRQVTVFIAVRSE